MRTNESEISMASSCTESKMSDLRSGVLYGFPVSSAGSILPSFSLLLAVSRDSGFSIKPLLQVFQPSRQCDFGTDCKKPDLIIQDLLACKSQTLTTKQLPQLNIFFATLIFPGLGSLYSRSCVVLRCICNAVCFQSSN